MQPYHGHYFPLAWPFLLGLFLLLGFLIAMVEIGILRYAYEKIGITRRSAFLLLLLSLFGSYVNIPVARFPPEHVESDKDVWFAGMHYIIPAVQDWPGTIIAINVGGALIPTLLSLYLVVKNSIYIRSVIGVAAVAWIVHQFAQPVKGLGISVPMYVPPIAAVVTAMILSWRNAAPLGYIVGSLGTLIGADLMNLERVRGLGAPVASIGGAGTFDGVFLAGIIAVLLAPTVSHTISKTTQTPEQTAEPEPPRDAGY
ncbi:MAG TPA: DUF1614 domain-containing protein [Pirellulales bacterium]|jgi:uncharacterized membrane protein|nr:DUF1614 domain-containing protein [Pirellulales bacterium]